MTIIRNHKTAVAALIVAAVVALVLVFVVNTGSGASGDSSRVNACGDDLYKITHNYFDGTGATYQEYERHQAQTILDDAYYHGASAHPDDWKYYSNRVFIDVGSVCHQVDGYLIRIGNVQP